MEAPIILTRKDYQEGLTNVMDAINESGTYMEQFKIELPEGMNTASTLQICRIMEKADLEAKINLMRVCLRGKNVKVTCPNGDLESFCMTNENDALEVFPLFQKEPLALTAIADCVYGYILKKYVRPSKKAQGQAATQMQ